MVHCYFAGMLKTSCRNLLRLSSLGMSVTRIESGIPSLNEIKKSEDDYHPSKYTILVKKSYAGNKRKDPMHYTDRKVGRGYWHFSNTIFHSRPKIHPKTSKGIKLNFYLIFILLLGLCIDYDWYVISILVNKLVITFVSVDCLLLGYQIKKFEITNFCPEVADCNPRETKSTNRQIKTTN
uniref:Uncharacterized protein n=1 Tax=Wuchereria bancrofti TaxID=6293 RepID=A0A1I8EQB7_WUCBA